MLRVCVRMVAALTLALAAFGVLVISYAGKAQASTQDPFHFLEMQLIFLGGSVVAGAALYFLDYRLFREKWVLWTLAAAMVVGLLLVFVPGLGKTVKGSHRWIGLGPVNVQPVEFVKLMMVVFLSAYLGRVGALVRRWKEGFLVPLALLGAVGVPLLLQPDFGGLMVVAGLSGALLLAGGADWRRWGALALLGALLLGAVMATNENRMARLRNEATGQNYQTFQAQVAFSNGGLTGVGLGRGMQKEHYLPECHTDFIFAVIGEDLGLAATGAICGAYLLLLLGGTVIALRAPDRQGSLLAFGATLLICAQAAANMAVVTHLFPTKGLALPFLSYGGSSLLTSFCAIGLILGVGRRALDAEDAPETPGKRLVSLQ